MGDRESESLLMGERGRQKRERARGDRVRAGREVKINDRRKEMEMD